jgi:hypothetical protein
VPIEAAFQALQLVRIVWNRDISLGKLDKFSEAACTYAFIFNVQCGFGMILTTDVFALFGSGGVNGFGKMSKIVGNNVGQIRPRV